MILQRLRWCLSFLDFHNNYFYVAIPENKIHLLQQSKTQWLSPDKSCRTSGRLFTRSSNIAIVLIKTYLVWGVKEKFFFKIKLPVTTNASCAFHYLFFFFLSLKMDLFIFIYSLCIMFTGPHPSHPSHKSFSQPHFLLICKGGSPLGYPSTLIFQVSQD